MQEILLVFFFVICASVFFSADLSCEIYFGSYKSFFMLNSTEHEISIAHKT